VAPEPRTPEAIRGELAAEREQLVGALGDLRRDVRATARKLPLIAGGALAAGLALAAARAAAKRLF
jgi:hypothetical protein